MSTTNAGHEQGFADACDWIVDLRASDPEEAQLAESLRAALRPGQLGAHETLINALAEGELETLVGVDLRTADGEWTGDACNWFSSYDRGWTSAIEDRLAKAESDRG